MKARDIEKKLAKSGVVDYVNKVDYISRNKKSRQRGYAFENWLVKEVSGYPYWGARRLGGSSTGLPDVMMSYAKLIKPLPEKDYQEFQSIIVATECKEGESNTLYVEREQVRRAYAAITALWQSIDSKWILLAFKFLRNQTQYKARTQTLTRFVLIPYMDIYEWLKSNTDKYKELKILFRYDIVKEELSIIQNNPNTGNTAITKYKEGQQYEIFNTVAELIGYLEHV